MTYHQISLNDLAGTDLIPQAIIGKSASSLADHLGIKLEKDHDELDEFEGAAIHIDRGPRFALKHYRGYPMETIAIYLPDRIDRLNEISDTIKLIADVLRIPSSWIVWQRADQPDL